MLTLIDIHGLGELAMGKYILPKPFILNNAETDEDALIVDENSNVIYEPESIMDIKDICRKGKLPSKFNAVWLSYSQICATRKEKGTNENIKHNFLNSIASKSVFIFDESHIAATGVDTIIGEFCRELISKAKGAVFASATYAKNPQAFGLYVIKTSLSEAQIPMAELEQAIQIGGENVSEYIASAMVKEGQMIRRERSYAGCEISTVNRDPNTPLELAKQEVYTKFDNSTRHFRDLIEYLRGDAFKSGVHNAVMRAASQLARAKGKEIELVDEESWGVRARSMNQQDAEVFFNLQNGKYVPYIDYDTIGGTARFNFKESLFLAVKAKLTADTIIKGLQTREEVTYLDNSKHLTNRKPVIAIRSTLESVFDKMDAGIGDIIQNDFSEYTKALIRDCETGRVVFRQVTPDFFTYNKLSARQKSQINYEQEYVVEDEDLPDGGIRLNELRNTIMEYSSGIPLSVIDYLRERIESEVREDWDSIVPNNPSTKNPSKKYVFGEVTGRTKCLKKVTGGWKIEIRNREQTKALFNQFNSGLIDVLLINSAGSTGQSAQSSSKFPDQRPRIMYILQPELNINTEVQKRGRIHRTGQVNLPAYTYIVSLIPAEIRTLIALMSKLRKLDANTSANQVQSSEVVDIKDKNGNPIEDIYNKYGVEAFMSEFINLDENEYYRLIYQNEILNKPILWADENTVMDFSREMDFQLSSYQEDYYDQMNSGYRQVVAKHKEAGTFRLEIDTENYKAALKARAVVALGQGDTEFSKPLFLEDKYTLEQRKTLTKEKIASKVAELCGGERPDKWHEDLISDFHANYDIYIDWVLERRQESAPDRDRYVDDEAYAEAIETFEQLLQSKREELNIKKARLSSKRKKSEDSGTGILDFFVPNRPCLIPDFVIGMQEIGTDAEGGDNENTDEKTEGDKKDKKAAEKKDKKTAEKKEQAKKDREDSLSLIPARFIGYKFLNTNPNNKYSEANIELHFALLNGTPPMLKLKPSKNYRALRYIIEYSMLLSKSYAQSDRDTIDRWEFDPNKRYVRRFLSGNILSAIVRANKMQKTELIGNEGYKKKKIKDWGLVRYTNFDGSVSTGIILDYGVDDVAQRYGGVFEAERVWNSARGEYETTNNIKSSPPVTVPCVNEALVEYIKLTPAKWRKWSDKGELYYQLGQAPMLRGLIKIIRPKGEADSFQLHLYTIIKVSKDKSKLIVTDIKGSNYNKYYFDETLNRILADRFYDNSEYTVNIEGKANVDSSRQMMGKTYKFDFNNVAHIDTFKRAMQYLWDKEKVLVEFRANPTDYYAVINMEDEFLSKSKSDKQEKLFELGEYEYMRTSKFDPLRNPPSDMVVNENESRGMYGSITLSLPLEPHVAITYGLYPINLPSDVSIKLFLAMFDEQERARIIKQLNDLVVNKKESNYELGEWAEREGALKLPNLKYIFGTKGTSQIGEIFKTYATNGDLSKIEYELAEDVVSVSPSKLKTVVDFTGAEKFLISMLS